MLRAAVTEFLKLIGIHVGCAVDRHHKSVTTEIECVQNKYKSCTQVVWNTETKITASSLTHFDNVANFKTSVLLDHVLELPRQFAWNQFRRARG